MSTLRNWYVYILYCSDGSLYAGITTDIHRRLLEHNSGVKGARYTRSRKPVELVYLEQVSDRSEASKREYEIKNMPLSRKISLVLKQLQREKNDSNDLPDVSLERINTLKRKFHVQLST
ncbi:MAG: GIY-YIG nuclease family protein [Gammaproteobacteria bacterium]|nr:GIY-YIG nuclease family protein [Gammaproteobacteria bacterium]